jgi:signal transduction histidine kinase
VARRNSAYAAEANDYARDAAGIAPRLALFVVSVVFVGFFVNAFQYVIDAGPTVGRIAPALACLFAMLYLQLAVFSNPNAQLRGPRGYLALAAQFCLVVVPLIFYGNAWTGMPGFFAGAALLVLRPLPGWIVFGIVSLGAGYVQAVLTDDSLQALYIAKLTATTGLIVFGLSWLRSLVNGLDEARSSLAGLAVTRERLRFARDLHDLLGFSLSAITLKSELTHRLVPTMPDRARKELTEILDISRKALADVRAVASSHRELSLAEEVVSARSVLAAAEVAVTINVEADDVPVKIRSALATVLREGVTNLLRHSKAEQCVIAVARDSRGVSIEIVNDGVRCHKDGTDRTDRTDSTDIGAGIGNLTARVEALDGSLTAGYGPDETHRLYAWIPLPADDDPVIDAAGDDLFDRTPSMAPRLAYLVVVAVFVGYTLNSVVFALAANLDATGTIVASACSALSFAMVLGFFTRPGAKLRSPQGFLALVVQAVLTYLPVLLYEDPMLGLPGFLAGCALLALPNAAGIGAFVGVVASIGAVQWMYGGTEVDIGYGFLATINHGLVVYGMSRLRSMVYVMHKARTELAHLAVTKERLRFARDLHDLLGNSLSYITMKVELTRLLADKDPVGAMYQLTGILSVSRKALADVRAVASSYRELSLDEEIESARALLAAARIEVTLSVDGSRLPQPIRAVLAIMLHEGVTNLLRHSNARHCAISLSHTDTHVTMDITNDGIMEQRTPAATGGIHILTSRIADLDGTLCAHPDPNTGTYRLRAEIPLP